MDRCFISTLAINSSLAKLELQNNLHGVRKWIHNSIISGNLRYPDVVCYLRVSPEDSLARKNKIYSLSDVWSSLAGVTFGYSFYETFFAEDHFFRAHIINANGELADVKRSLHGVIKNF
jgi:thymidylate kinase